ncbi:MAG: hypothetical protein ACRD04_06850 [Terriglobales bacterium]
MKGTGTAWLGEFEMFAVEQLSEGRQVRLQLTGGEALGAAGVLEGGPERGDLGG